MEISSNEIDNKRIDFRIVRMKVCVYYGIMCYLKITFFINTKKHYLSLYVYYFFNY